MCDPPTGHSGRDGQPSVHSGGDTVEILLEVQPEQWRRITQPVSVTNTRQQWNGRNTSPYISSTAVAEYKWSVSSSRHNESEKRLPKSCLVVLSKYEPVLLWTKECDNLLYQTLVEMLIPDVLRPIPSKKERPAGALTQNRQIYSMPAWKGVEELVFKFKGKFKVFSFCYTLVCLNVISNPFCLSPNVTIVPATGPLTEYFPSLTSFY